MGTCSTCGRKTQAGETCGVTISHEEFERLIDPDDPQVRERLLVAHHRLLQGFPPTAAQSTDAIIAALKATLPTLEHRIDVLAWLLWKGDEPNPPVSAPSILERIEALEQQARVFQRLLDERTAALAKYGAHRRSCTHSTQEPFCVLCTCGLADALAVPSASKEAPDGE